MSELEGGDVGAADDLVVGVHAAAHAVGSGVLDLGGGVSLDFWDVEQSGRVRGLGTVSATDLPLSLGSSLVDRRSPRSSACANRALPA